MKVKEVNFLASQAFYGLCVSNPGIDTIEKARPFIHLARQIAKEMINLEKYDKDTRNNKQQTIAGTLSGMFIRG